MRKIWTALQVVKKEVSWNLKVSPDVKPTSPPTKEEVNIIRTLDSQKIYTGDGLRKLTFENYIGMLDSSYEKQKAMFSCLTWHEVWGIHYGNSQECD